MILKRLGSVYSISDNTLVIRIFKLLFFTLFTNLILDLVNRTNDYATLRDYYAYFRNDFNEFNFGKEDVSRKKLFVPVANGFLKYADEHFLTSK